MKISVLFKIFLAQIDNVSSKPIPNKNSKETIKLDK